MTAGQRGQRPRRHNNELIFITIRTDSIPMLRYCQFVSTWFIASARTKLIISVFCSIRLCSKQPRSISTERLCFFPGLSPREIDYSPSLTEAIHTLNQIRLQIYKLIPINFLRGSNLLIPQTVSCTETRVIFMIAETLRTVNKLKLNAAVLTAGSFYHIWLFRPLSCSSGWFYENNKKHSKTVLLKCFTFSFHFYCKCLLCRFHCFTLYFLC